MPKKTSLEQVTIEREHKILLFMSVTTKSPGQSWEAQTHGPTTGITSGIHWTCLE